LTRRYPVEIITIEVDIPSYSELRLPKKSLPPPGIIPPLTKSRDTGTSQSSTAPRATWPSLQTQHVSTIARLVYPARDGGEGGRLTASRIGRIDALHDPSRQLLLLVVHPGVLDGAPRVPVDHRVGHALLQAVGLVLVAHLGLVEDHLALIVVDRVVELVDARDEVVAVQPRGEAVPALVLLRPDPVKERRHVVVADAAVDLMVPDPVDLGWVEGPVASVALACVRGVRGVVVVVVVTLPVWDSSASWWRAMGAIMAAAASGRCRCSTLQLLFVETHAIQLDSGIAGRWLESRRLNVQAKRPDWGELDILPHAWVAPLYTLLLDGVHGAELPVSRVPYLAERGARKPSKANLRMVCESHTRGTSRAAIRRLRGCG
jgi:hypothetical protein